MSNNTPNLAKNTLKSLALCLPLVLAACSTMKVSPEARLAYDNTQRGLQNQQVAIITDGCVLWVEMGKDDIKYQQSNVVSMALAQDLNNKLVARGVQVGHISSPLICGSLTQEELSKMDILTTEDAEEIINTDYPILSSTNNVDATINQAYLNLYQAIASAKGEGRVKEGDHIPLNLDQASIETIRRSEGSDHIFVGQVMAVEQSFGLRAVVATTSPLAGALINRPVGQYYTIHLINLKSNKVEWSKLANLGSDVFKMDKARALAIEDVLHPLYP